MTPPLHPASGQRRAALAWILARTKDLLPPLILASVLATFTRLVSLAIYYVAALGLVRAAGLDVSWPGAAWDFPVLGVSLVVLALLKGGLRYAEQFVGHRVAFLALARLRTQIYADYERQAPFAAGAHSGAMLQRAVRDIDRVEVFFAHTLPPAVAAVLVSAVVSGGVMASGELGSGLLLVAGYLLVGLVVPLLGVRTIARAAVAETTARRRMSAQIGDTLAGAEVVFSLNAQEPLAARLTTEANEKAVLAASARWLGVRSALVGLTPWVIALLILGQGVGHREPGTLLMVLVLCVPSFEAVRAVDGFVGSLQESLHSIERLHANHQKKPPVPEPIHPQHPGQIPSGLQATGLTVMRGKTAVVQGLNLEVKPGHRVGLVGASGSGKSSVLAALIRAIPATGQVTLDAVDTASLALHELRERVVVVSQSDSLVRGTLRENLLLGRADIADEQLIAGLEEVGLGRWFATQRAGLDTPLGERGSRISGGQRQRLVLLRALLRDPGMLLLDEATSALDQGTETLVLKALERRVQQGMGLLMISHRLGVLQDFEKIVVLEQGMIQEQGSAAQLLADEHSLFHRMRLRELASIETKS